MKRYNVEVVADSTYHDTRFDCDAMIRVVTFRDLREHRGDPDAYNDYFVSEPPDPMCYDKLSTYAYEDTRRYEMRKQWKRDVLDALGIRSGEIGHTGSEFFTAIEITGVE